MEQYRFIAVVLVYRNSDDLIECILSMQAKIDTLKIIVVNSYYDDESMKLIKSISEMYKCDFLNVENKGYSYGNNIGIDYALKHYDFDYVIISNPDIIVKEFKTPQNLYDLIAPCIIAKDGRMQNPMIIKRSHLSEWLVYYGLKNNLKILLYIGISIGKLCRAFYMKIKNKGLTIFPIYQPHGSFVLISKRVVEKLHPIYDENMFLFAEEGVLALKAKNAGFQSVYCSSIIINHKEDGSMKLSKNPINNELKKSNVYFYETYVKKTNRNS